MSTPAKKLRVDNPVDLSQGFRDRSQERSQPADPPVVDPPAAPANDAAASDDTKQVATIHVVPAPGPLVLSAETTERLRQILRTENLTSEAQLLELTKHALAMQYLRGQNEGAFQAGKDPARLPSRSTTKPARVDSWEQHRRAQRKAKVRNVLATMVILVLATTGIVAIGMFRPALSGDSPQAAER